MRSERVPDWVEKWQESKETATAGEGDRRGDEEEVRVLSCEEMSLRNMVIDVF